MLIETEIKQLESENSSFYISNFNINKSNDFDEKKVKLGILMEDKNAYIPSATAYRGEYDYMVRLFKLLRDNNYDVEVFDDPKSSKHDIIFLEGDIKNRTRHTGRGDPVCDRIVSFTFGRQDYVSDIESHIIVTSNPWDPESTKLDYIYIPICVEKTIFSKRDVFGMCIPAKSDENEDTRVLDILEAHYSSNSEKLLEVVIRETENDFKRSQIKKFENNNDFGRIKILDPIPYNMFESWVGGLSLLIWGRSDITPTLHKAYHYGTPLYITSDNPQFRMYEYMYPNHANINVSASIEDMSNFLSSYEYNQSQYSIEFTDYSYLWGNIIKKSMGEDNIYDSNSHIIGYRFPWNAL